MTPAPEPAATDAIDVPEPILNTPYDEPARHWFIRENQPPERREGRRPALVYPPRDDRKTRPVAWTLGDTLTPSAEYAPGLELALVSRLRKRVTEWRAARFPGATRITQELLRYWRRGGRQWRLFFAQVEAAETVIFLTEARADLRQGVAVPRDQPDEGTPFVRYACKMATGSGKTTVMAMLAAWSILNKVRAANDKRFSDFILVVCPNVTIRDRLRELDPAGGAASLYRTRDIVPEHDTPDLSRGRLAVTSWHTLELRGQDQGGTLARVSRHGRRVERVETVTFTANPTKGQHGRTVTPEAFPALRASGALDVIDGSEKRDAAGNVTAVSVRTADYVESDTAWLRRVIDQPAGGTQKTNVMVFNDEAHHAYRFNKQPVARRREGPMGGTSSLKRCNS